MIRYSRWRHDAKFTIALRRKMTTYSNSDCDDICPSGVPTIDDAWCEDERNLPATVGDKAWKGVIHVGELVIEVSK